MELLQQHFDTAFAAPDGVKKLRELILTLAMQGKLVPQDPSDPSASQLLKEIDAKKKRLVKEGKIKAPKPLQEIKPEEVPYALPQGWEWVRLGNISEYIQRGKGPTYSETPEVPVISQKCIQWSGFDKSVVRFIDPTTLDKYQDERFIRNGDLLWNSTGTGTIGRINLYRDELSKFKKVVADSHVTVVRLTGLCNPFLLNYLMSPAIQSRMEENASGTTNQIELNTTTVINQVVPLPPLPEQHRIVAKIDQLMARCDELEKLRAEHTQKRRSVHTAALKQLLDAKSGNTFADAWKFINQHFGELYGVRENVSELRKAILQLAILGKLVPQDPSDPPASQLLKEIEAEKQRLVKEGKIKAPKPLQEIKPKEVPYSLPLGWEWVRLGSIATFENGDRSHRYPNESDHQASGVPFFGAKDIVDGVLRFDNGLRFISEAKFSELSNGKLMNKDFVVLLRGTVGKIAIFRSTSEFTTGFINAQMLIVRILNTELCNFFGSYSSTNFFQSLVTNKTTGSAVRQMPGNVVADFPVPLPPLPEQYRIVAKIDQLMTLCDMLEQQIDDAASKQTQVLNAVMAQV